MAAGDRAQTAAVAAYLNTIVNPTRLPQRTLASLTARHGQAAAAAAAATDPLDRLSLVQRRLDLEAELDKFARPDTSAVDGFVAHAAGYAARKGISYRAFREFGVPAEVLRRAGIHP